MGLQPTNPGSRSQFRGPRVLLRADAEERQVIPSSSVLEPQKTEEYGISTQHRDRTEKKPTSHARKSSFRGEDAWHAACAGYQMVVATGSDY